MIYAADLFCGAGGTSTGLAKAAQRLGLPVDLVAVNHWQRAVETHSRNHPWARHVCADLASCEADPNRLIPGGRLDLLVASPECTHHSNARGGKPCSDQSRASAWHVLHWCERLRIKNVLVENVREFEQWGPLGVDGRPIKQHKGATFQAFVHALRSMGYAVEWKVLNAADFGAATTRRRLFLRASLGKIEWPTATHAGRWRAAREIIDWDLKGQDIRDRKRPLAPRTLARIEAGLRKFGGESFLVVLAHTGADASRVSSTHSPVPTIPAGHRGEHGLAQPFIIPMEHHGGERLRPDSEPLPSITTAKGGAFGLCEPFVTKYYGTGISLPVTQPLDTVTTKDRYALVEPYRMGIRFRMLQPHELAAAMGFVGYQFAGTKTEIVKQIGNAVSVEMAEALCASILRRVAA